MEETQTPGVAVGLLHEGEEHVAGFGVTSLENPLEVTPDTLFQIGSITKTFTGTAAMRLVERGELDLDAPVRTYLPGLKLSDEDVAARVTMRHLLTHTGGWIGDYFDDSRLRRRRARAHVRVDVDAAAADAARRGVVVQQRRLLPRRARDRGPRRQAVRGGACRSSCSSRSASSRRSSSPTT